MASNYSTDYELCCLLLGRTGWGKSTTGNKLIGSQESENYIYQPYYKKPTMLLNNTESQGDIKIPKKDYNFEVGKHGSLESTTSNCQLIANKTLKICVLDTKGFADSHTTVENGVYPGNLQIIREILRIQQDQGITFNRIIYFLPVRDIPEKIDGHLQEELKIMHYFFGKNIFDCMVIVLTTNPLEDLSLHLDEYSKKHSKRVFVEAVKASCQLQLDGCPPLIHINRDDSSAEVRRKIKSANVIRPTNIKLKVTEHTCLKCASKILPIPSDGDIKTEVIEGKSGQQIEINNSYCHPEIIPKYSTFTKIFGSLGNILTIGITYVAFGLPGYFNAEEKCINCKKPPGKPGCLKFGTYYKHHYSDATANKMLIQHSYELPIITTNNE